MQKKNMKKVANKNISLNDTILSIIVIVQNDEDIIKECLDTLNVELRKLNTFYEIIIVDNGSQDETSDAIQKLHRKISNIRTIHLSKQYDVEIALTAGFDSCIGDFVILFNIYSDPSSVIPIVLENLLRNYDIVIGKPKYSIFKKTWINILFLKIVEKISTHQFRYYDSYLTGLNRKAVNSITRTRRKSRNFSYINHLIGFRKIIIEYAPLKKFKKKLKQENFFEVFLNVTDIIISNSFKPIRFLSLLGILASFIFLLYVFAVIIATFIFKMHIAPQGWITMGTIIGTMFLLLFSLLSIIAEYIIRIVTETRNEPFYFIADETDKSNFIAGKKTLNVIQET